MTSTTQTRISTESNTTTATMVDHLESMLARMQRYGVDSREVEELVESANGYIRNRLRNVRDNIRDLIAKAGK